MFGARGCVNLILANIIACSRLYGVDICSKLVYSLDRFLYWIFIYIFHWFNFEKGASSYKVGTLKGFGLWPEPEPQPEPEFAVSLSLSLNARLTRTKIRLQAEGLTAKYPRLTIPGGVWGRKWSSKILREVLHYNVLERRSSEIQCEFKLFWGEGKGWGGGEGGEWA